MATKKSMWADVMGTRHIDIRCNRSRTLRNTSPPTNEKGLKTENVNAAKSRRIWVEIIFELVHDHYFLLITYSKV